MTPHPDGQQVPVPTEEERRGLPAPGYHGAGSGAEAETRKRMAWWDRIKFLLLFFLLFWFFVWSDLSDDNPFNTFGDAVANTLRTKWPLFVAIGVELLRQIHYIVAEHSPRYYAFWNRMFERWERRTHLVNDWNRYRISRVIKVLVLLGVASVVLAAIYDVTPITALFELPSRIWGWLPTVFQLLFAMVFLIGQFAALFWFLSRGGVDTYMPDEIKTRFSDVWGQDAVLARVKENMVFLDRPEAIEDKGGYVPGGLLLWGPPGTGKTLMAEAVAGETGKPFVFVDPGAFTNMFMGVGILKVKGLFRKLRKLALRYGGVIVFFDEADALGNRGQLTPGPFGQPGATPAPASPWSVDGSEHLRWLSPQSQAAVLQSSLAPATPDDRPPRVVDRIIMGGMGGGGGMGTLQALLSEMSGLKKPRGFINRIVRRTLGMRPKPPPKYRILVMMATNMPQSLDEALLRPGRIDRMYKVGYPSKEGRKRTYEGYLAKVSHELTPEDDRQAGHHHALRDRRVDEGSGQRGPHLQHPGGTRGHHLGGRHQGEAPQGAGPARGRRVHRARASCHRHPRVVPCRRRLPQPQAPHDRPGHHREGRQLPRHGVQHQARGPVHPVAQRVRVRHRRVPGLVGGGADVLRRGFVVGCVG